MSPLVTAMIVTSPDHFSHGIRALERLPSDAACDSGEVIATIWARSLFLMRRRLKLEILGTVDPRFGDPRTLDLCVSTAASIPTGLCFARGAGRTFLIRVTRTPRV